MIGWLRTQRNIFFTFLLHDYNILVLAFHNSKRDSLKQFNFLESVRACREERMCFKIS